MLRTFPRLVVRDAFGNQRETEITHTLFSWGRQGNNELALLDNRISRHAGVVQDENGYLLEDMVSRRSVRICGPGCPG